MTFNNYGEYYDFIEDNTKFTGVCAIFCKDKKWFEHNFVNGKKHGKQYCWYSNGQKEYEYNYVNGNLFGIQLEYGKTYEMKPKENPVWYILVEESL